VEWIDVPDQKAQATSAHQTHTLAKSEQESGSDEAAQVVKGKDDKDWLPPRDSNPDMLIQSQS
jgi:hypothetical protein